MLRQREVSGQDFCILLRRLTILLIQSISTTLVLLFAAKGVTLVDAFTRYVYLKPVKSTKSHNSIRALSEYFGIFGVPRRLISDRGTSFTSASFKRFMHDKSIKHILNAVATPRANGQVEQYNKVIIDALTAKSVGSPENTWDEHLPDVQWSMNNTLNKGINPFRSIVRHTACRDK